MSSPKPTYVPAIVAVVFMLFVFSAACMFNQTQPCPGEYFVTVEKQAWTEFGPGGKVIAVHDAHTIQERHCKE